MSLRPQYLTVFIYKTPKQREIESTFDFSRLKPGDAKTVKKVIEKNFTQNEIKTMAVQGKVIISKGNVDRGAYGHVNEGEKGNPLIILGKDHDEETIVHEVIHHLRTTDKTRKKYSKTAYPINNKGEIKYYKIGKKLKKVGNAEETATSAETEIRIGNPNHYTNGYWDIYKGEEIPKKVRLSDRSVLRTGASGEVLPENLTIKGEKVKELMNRNYPHTEISGKTSDDDEPEEALVSWYRINTLRSKGKW